MHDDDLPCSRSDYPPTADPISNCVVVPHTHFSLSGFAAALLLRQLKQRSRDLESHWVEFRNFGAIIGTSFQ
jgi:hypothetical protein